MVGQVKTLHDCNDAILSLLADLMAPYPIGSSGAKTTAELRQELANHNKSLIAGVGALITDTRESATSPEGLNKHAQALSINIAQLLGTSYFTKFED